MGNMGIVPLNHAPHGISLRHKDLSLVGTMGTMFPCVSLVEKNENSLYKRIKLPMLPVFLALQPKQFFPDAFFP